MRRSRKKERLEASTSTSRPEEDHDLAYFIHDRVELMRRVFCALTPKEIKAMAPAALRKASNDELEELCLEELLGISSKRLCAVLDGAEAPSDTESSSDSSEPPPVTIELDSSEDDKSKSSGRTNKNKKKRERKKKNKSQPRGVGDAGGEQGLDDDRTSARGSAGLTVLELLELQARARALKAQLRATEGSAHAAVQSATLEPCSELAAAVKEEQAIVVEISSDEEKPDVRELKTKGGTEPQLVTTNKKKNTADDPTLVSLIEDIVSTENATTAKKSSLKNSAENPVKNKKKTKDNTKINNTSQGSAFKSSWENEAAGKTNNTKKSLEDSNKKKNNETLVVTAKKKNSETQECSTSNAKEKEGAKKKKSKKYKRKSSEKSKETTEDKPKKNVESIVGVKAPADDVTIVIDDDDEPAPPTQKSPVRPLSARAAPLSAPASAQLTTRTIQLDRNSVVISLTTAETARETRIASTVTSVRKLHSSVKKVQKKRPVTPDAPKLNSVVVQAKEKVEERKRKKVNKRKKSMEDRDEITLQLSDSEKMDLLEDLDRSALDKVSSSSAASTVTSDSGDECEYRSDGKDQGDEASVDSDEVSSTVPAVVEDVSEYVEERVGDGKDKETKVNLVAENPKNNVTAKVTEQSEEEISNDTVIDSTTNENDVINIVINQDVDKDCSNEGSNVSTEKEAPITTQSMLIDEDEINQQNVNVNNGNTIEVSCINDIPIIPDDYNLKLPDNVQGATDNDDKTGSSEDSSADSDASDEQSSSDEDAKTDEKMRGDSENFRQIVAIKDDNGGIVVDKECAVEESDKEKAEKTIESGEEIIEKRLQSERVPSEEGELSDKSSSDVEAFDMKPEVVCISDDDGDTQTLRKNKKTKKSKKLKKIKKHKKGDVANKGDEKYDKKTDRVPVIVPEDGKTDDGIIEKKQTETKDPKDDVASADKESSQTMTVDSDDVYEILELSDDSSCFEVEGVSVLSKEPTSEEIVALSAKIDEIERQDVVTDQDIIEHEQQISTKQSETGIIENVSWKDRYLDSKKVKKVLTTSNILNAMRKKNIELKKKMLEAKQKEAELEAKEKEVEENETPQDIPVEEGSIEHYNTLQGSNKYVDPVLVLDKVENSDMEQGPSGSDNLDKTEVIETEQSDNIEIAPEATQETVTKEMKKDAKQLLKMYKRLLKYNDINKPKNPNKKKKSKKQNKKKGGGSAAGVATCDNT